MATASRNEHPVMSPTRHPAQRGPLPAPPLVITLYFQASAALPEVVSYWEVLFSELGVGGRRVFCRF